MAIFNTSIPGGLIPGALPPNGWIAASVGPVSATAYVTGTSLLISVGSVNVHCNANYNTIGNTVSCVSGNIKVDGDANISTGNYNVSTSIGNVEAFPVYVVSISGYNIATTVGNISADGDANIDIVGYNTNITLGNVTAVVTTPHIHNNIGDSSDYMLRHESLRRKRIIPRNYDVYIDGFSVNADVGNVGVLVTKNAAKKNIPLTKSPLRVTVSPITLVNASIRLNPRPAPIKLVSPPIVLAEQQTNVYRKPITLATQNIQIESTQTINLVKPKIELVLN